MPTSLNQHLARKMVRQLRTGTTPLEGVRFLNVGRTRYFDEVNRLLDDIANGGGSGIKFLNADYGHGKTHFIGMINALALDRNWVTSYVKLSGTDGVRLDKFEQLYSAILRNCLCRPLIDAHHQVYDPGEANGWPWIMDDWIRRHRELEAKSGHDANSLGVRDRTMSALDLSLRRANVTGDFAQAVRLYTSSSFERGNDADRSMKEKVIRWFSCEKIPELVEKGILAPISNKNAKQILRGIVSLLKEFGYSGMAIFIDEAENVLTKAYSKAQRQIAYQNLRDLLDNVDGGVSGVGLNRVVTYVAATPLMFTGENGFREYPALQDRIEEIKLPIPAFSGLTDYRATVIDLGAAPLSPADRRELAHKIRVVHATAFTWQPENVVTDAWLEQIVSEFEKHSGERGGLRPLCKAVAKSLEMAQQHPAALVPQAAQALVSTAFREEVPA